MKTFDVIVIGSGSAGFAAAERANSFGANVAVVEAGAWGGECPNYACVPTKAMLKSAEMYYSVKEKAKKFGVYASDVRFNFRAIMKRTSEIVGLVTGDEKRLKEIAKDLGIETITGTAFFVDDQHIQVGANRYRAKKFIIATGSTDVIPPIDGLETVPYLSYKDVTRLKTQPSSVAIIGGGPVGCEFATFFGMLKTKTHVFQIAPRILHREDAEISLMAKKHLEDLGVHVQVNAAVTHIKKSGKQIVVTYGMGETMHTVRVDAVVLAAGKKANIEGLNIENAGIHLDERGWVKVNSTLQTNKKHIFAVGDVTGGMMFTHVAHEDGSLAGENCLKKTARSMKQATYKVVPRVTFVYPEVASVGITPQEATEQKKNFSIAAFPVGALSRSVTEEERRGIVKLVVDKKTRKILGGHILAPRAGEMIHEFALAMQNNLRIDDITHLMHAFPTYSEAVVAASSRL